MDVWKLLGFITHDPDPSKTQMKLICLSSPHFGEGCVCVCVCVFKETGRELSSSA